MTTGKTIALTIQTILSNVMSLLFNGLWFCHSFPSNKQASFNFKAVVTIPSDLEAQEKKICHCFHIFPSICRGVMGPEAMILDILMLSFKPAFSLSPFTLIKRLFSFSTPFCH